MLYQRWRSLLTAGLLVLAALIHYQLGWSSAWPLYLGAGFLLLTYFLFGTVRSAGDALQKGKLLLAERILRQTRFPALLLKPYRARYYFLLGLIQLQQKDLEAGALALQRALTLGLPHSSQKGLALLNLAHIYFVQKEYPKSRTFLDRARALQLDDLKLEEKLNELETALEGRA